MRTIVVSGGGTGIGFAIARRFVRAGDTVLIVGRRAGVLARAAQTLRAEASAGRVIDVAADVSHPDEAGQLPRKLAAAGLGQVDVVVNNAGGVDRTETGGLDQVAAQWERDFRTNVLSAVLLTHALLRSSRVPEGVSFTLVRSPPYAAAVMPTRRPRLPSWGGPSALPSNLAPRA